MCARKNHALIVIHCNEKRPRALAPRTRERAVVVRAPLLAAFTAGLSELCCRNACFMVKSVGDGWI